LIGNETGAFAASPGRRAAANAARARARSEPARPACALAARAAIV